MPAMVSPLGDLCPYLLQRRQLLFMAAGRLETLKALLPEEELLDIKYVAELHKIIDFIERRAALHLSRFRMLSRSRSEMRINLLALLSVCEYQARPPLSHWPQAPGPGAPRQSWRNVH